MTEILSLKPKILHISCHGIQNKEELMGQNFAKYNNVGDFLLFENVGEGELISRR